MFFSLPVPRPIAEGRRPECAARGRTQLWQFNTGVLQHPLSKYRPCRGYSAPSALSCGLRFDNRRWIGGYTRDGRVGVTADRTAASPLDCRCFNQRRIITPQKQRMLTIKVQIVAANG